MPRRATFSSSTSGQNGEQPTTILVSSRSARIQAINACCRYSLRLFDALKSTPFPPPGQRQRTSPSTGNPPFPPDPHKYEQCRPKCIRVNVASGFRRLLRTWCLPDEAVRQGREVCPCSEP